MSENDPTEGTVTVAGSVPPVVTVSAVFGAAVQFVEEPSVACELVALHVIAMK